MAAAVRFKKLVEEEESLGNENEGEENEIENDRSNRELVTLVDGTLTEEDVGKVEKKKCCKKCRNPFNSVAAVVIAIGVFALSLLISLIVVLLVKEPPPPFYTAAVATDVAVCSEMAGKVLERNGTAVDAAVTAMLCVGAVNPESSGIGGGGFMVVYDPSNQSVYSVNFRETAPAASTFDMFHSNANLSKRGGLAVAVPGELAGMKLIHDQFGRLPWEQLFEPVINITRDGFELTEHTANAIAYTAPYFANNSAFQRWFYSSAGKLKQAGDIVQRPEYSSLLALIAKEGPGIMYNGSIAEEIVEEVQSNGGIMTLEDLASYSPRQDPPLRVNYSNMDVYAPPVPSGGPDLLFALNVMELLGLSPESAYKNLTYQHLVETFKYMFAKRSYLGDPYCSLCANESGSIFQNQADMISEQYALGINKSISNSQTFPPSHYHPDYIPSDDGTTHISIIDSTGMAVSVTSTINTYFGSKLITPSGIVLNNEMDDFSSPNITNAFGLEPSEANFVRPFKRPLSSTCPVIVLKKDEKGVKFPYLIIGAAGGTHIPTATAQASLGVLSFGWSLSDAIEAKRLHHQLYNNTVYVESGYPSNITWFLHSLGHSITVDSMFAVVQGVRRESDGNVTAHSDSRKMGQPYILSS